MLYGMFALVALFAGVVGVFSLILHLATWLPDRSPSPRVGIPLIWAVGMLFVVALLLVEDEVMGLVVAAFELGREAGPGEGRHVVVGPAKGFLAMLLAIPCLYGLKFLATAIVAESWSRDYRVRPATAWLACLASFYVLYQADVWLAWSGLVAKSRWGFFEMAKFPPQAPLVLAVAHLIYWGILAWFLRRA